MPKCASTGGVGILSAQVNVYVSWEIHVYSIECHWEVRSYIRQFIENSQNAQ